MQTPDSLSTAGAFLDNEVQQMRRSTRVVASYGLVRHYAVGKRLSLAPAVFNEQQWADTYYDQEAVCMTGVARQGLAAGCSVAGGGQQAV